MSPDEWESLSPQEAKDFFNDYYESFPLAQKQKRTSRMWSHQDAKTWSDAIGIKVQDTTPYNDQFILSLIAFGPKTYDGSKSAPGFADWAIKAVYWFYIADNIGTMKVSYIYYDYTNKGIMKRLEEIDIEDIPISAQSLAIQVINEKFPRLHYLSPTKNCFLNYRGGIL